MSSGAKRKTGAGAEGHDDAERGRETLDHRPVRFYNQNEHLGEVNPENGTINAAGEDYEAAAGLMGLKTRDRKRFFTRAPRAQPLPAKENSARASNKRRKPTPPTSPRSTENAADCSSSSSEEEHEVPLSHPPQPQPNPPQPDAPPPNPLPQLEQALAAAREEVRNLKAVNARLLADCMLNARIRGVIRQMAIQLLYLSQPSARQ